MLGSRGRPGTMEPGDPTDGGWEAAGPACKMAAASAASTGLPVRGDGDQGPRARGGRSGRAEIGDTGPGAAGPGGRRSGTPGSGRPVREGGDQGPRARGGRSGWAEIGDPGPGAAGPGGRRPAGTRAPVLVFSPLSPGKKLGHAQANG